MVAFGATAYPVGMPAATATTAVKLCEASTVQCQRPTMSPAASLCRYHAEGLASGRERTAAAFEEAMRREREKLARLGRLQRHG